jgi:hypothetical protein
MVNFSKAEAEKLIRMHLHILSEESLEIPDIDLLFNTAKRCALVTVDVILSCRPGYPYPFELGLEIQGLFNNIHHPQKYWEQVKEEISKCDGKDWRV